MSSSIRRAGQRLMSFSSTSVSQAWGLTPLSLHVLDELRHDRPILGTLIMSREQTVFPVQGQGPDAALDRVGVDLDAAIAVGRATSSARTRGQSCPSSSVDNCAGERRITPSSIRGQQNLRSSRRLISRQMPVLSQNSNLIRSARFERKT